MNRPGDASDPRQGWHEGRYSLLLVLLVAMIVVSPLAEEWLNGTFARTVLVSLVILAAIACLQAPKLKFLTPRWFGVLTLVAGLIPLVTAAPGLLILGAAFRVVFFALVTFSLIYQIARSRDVTIGTIVGAVDGYLLLGFMSAAGFTISALASPGSIRGAQEGIGGTDLIYYSFITMTTVGYGDIVPAGAAARSIAILTAVAGQLYIAILVSLLVGKYLARKSPEGDRG